MHDLVEKLSDNVSPKLIVPRKTKMKTFRENSI